MTATTKNRWLQASILATANSCDLIEETLYSLGAVSTSLTDSLDQPILEPRAGETPLWRDITINALFLPESADDHSEQCAQLCEQINNALQSFPELSTTECEVVWLEEKDWERECLDQFEPIIFPNKLRVCPSWKHVPNDKHIDVLLDPGLAFGTGTHPTTYLCLEWLDANQLHEKTIIDFGCGSGILGIAALKLGAKRVVFVDNDPQAIQASEENLRRNEIPPERFQLICNENNHEASLPQSDIVLANILAQPLIDLAENISSLLDTGGSLVLSGLLTDQADKVSIAYKSHFGSLAAQAREGWLRLSGDKIR